MTDQQDVVLVTVDSFRADHCGHLGDDRGLTPTLDRMAREGLAFETAIAPAAATLGSMPTVFTGEYPAFTRIGSNTSVEDGVRDHVATRETLPERLSRRGYETAAFTANPWTSRYFGFDAGFDRFEDFLDADGGKQSLDSGGSLASQALDWWRGQDMFMSWEAFYDDVIEHQRSADSPSFIWLFLVDAHMPFLPGDGYRTQSRLVTYLANLWLYAGNQDVLEGRMRSVLAEAYANTVRYVDAFLDRLTAEMAGDPLVVVHGDHGEEFGEHGNYGHGPNLYDENLRVPLVVGNGPTETVSEPFSLRNLPDLVVDLATGEGVDGLTGPYATAKNNDPKRAVRGRDWSYVWSTDGDELHRVADGTQAELDDPELRDVGRSIVRQWNEHERECDRVDAAARAVAATDAV